jgi:hypothetical protein
LFLGILLNVSALLAAAKNGLTVKILSKGRDNSVWPDFWICEVNRAASVSNKAAPLRVQDASRKDVDLSV